MKGVFTALITPFDSQGAVDLKAFRKVLDDQIDAKVAGVIPCGTTGETPTLSVEEKEDLIRTSIEACRGTGVKVLAGTGSNDTDETVELSKWASDQGVDGVLVVTPYYNKPSQAGLVEHFLAVAREVNCEVMLYNVPGRTGVSLTAQSICDLAENSRITSLKEATANIQFTSEILDCSKKNGHPIDILSGDDATFLPLLSVGAVGVVSVASNLFPRAMIQIQKMFESGNVKEATAIHRRYFPLFRDLFIESNPVPIKYAMSMAGFCETRVRRPLVKMSSTSIAQLSASLKECGIQAGSRA